MSSTGLANLHQLRGIQPRRMLFIWGVFMMIMALVVGSNLSPSEAVRISSSQTTKSFLDRLLVSSECTTTKVSSCTSKCHTWRNQGLRVRTSCAIGSEVLAKKSSACFAACEEDTSCSHVEVYRIKGESQLVCQLYSCSILDGPKWKQVENLRKYWSWQLECSDQETTEEDTCGLTTSREASAIWGIDLSNDLITSPMSAEIWKTSSDLISIAIRGAELPAAQNLGIDTSHQLHGKRPNIILVLADDIGVGDTGVSQINQNAKKLNTLSTPNMQRMANKGVVFTRAYSPNSVCLPSRYSMLVGRHAGHSRVRGNSGIYDDIPLADDDVTMASMLQSAGYKTALVGKWGLGEYGQQSHPIQKGFDWFYGQLTHLDAHACFPVSIYNNSVDGKNNAEKYGSSDLLPRNQDASEDYCSGLDAPFYDPSDTKCDFVQDVFTNAAIDYVKDHVATYTSETGDLTTPFFVYLSLTIPHVCSWSSNPNDKQRKVAPYSDANCKNNLVRAPNNENSERGVDDQECAHKSIMENYIDRDIGRLMDLIDQYDQLTNTLLIFVGDNGPERVEADQNLVVNVRNGFKVLHSVDTFNSTNGRRGLKRMIYEGSLLMPAIMYWKGVTSGVVSDTPMSSVDLFTTFGDVAGLSPIDLEVGGSVGLKRPLDSVSLVPSIAGDDDGQTLHRYLYFEYCDQQTENWRAIKKNPDTYCSWALHIRDWKMLYTTDAKEMELYNLADDPYESNNLYVAEDDADSSPKSSSLYAQQETMSCIKTSEAYISLKDAGFSANY